MIASELAMATNFTGIDHISKVKAQASCAPRIEAAEQSSPDRRDAAPNLAIISPLAAAKPDIDWNFEGRASGALEREGELP
jgi:hypothetical protein